VPFKVRPGEALNVTLLIFNSALLATVTLDVLFVPLPKPPALVTFNEPLFTLVAPVYWFVPDNVKIPAIVPVSVNPPLPVIALDSEMVPPFVLNVARKPPLVMPPVNASVPPVFTPIVLPALLM
jgi:hypothetical protein